jgi:hypothetical protein
MISDSPKDIVEWTEGGDKFIVKDQEKLASDCIPRYFNHNNFSSFTRQLNFYRFRKMFPSAFAKQGDNAVNEKHLIFYHEKFNRDHPEWLPDIKRSTKTTKSSAEQEAIIEELQSQVSTLEKRVTILSSELHLKVSTLATEFERKLLDVRSSMGHDSYHHHSRYQSRAHMPPPPPLTHVPMPAPPRPTALNRYSTEDFIRSLVTGAGGMDDGDDRGRARAMPAPPMRAPPKPSLAFMNADASEAVPPPPRALNRLGTLTLDDINRIVTHLEGDGRVGEKEDDDDDIPGPPNPPARINSLSAEEVLMTIRQMDNSKGGKHKR